MKVSTYEDVLRRVADPGSGVFLTPGSGIRGWVKNQDPDPDEQPGSYSESLETIFWVKILKLFDVDPGSGMQKVRIWDTKDLNSGSEIRDKHPDLLQHTGSYEYN